jgi:hypothetical protein
MKNTTKSILFSLILALAIGIGLSMPTQNRTRDIPLAQIQTSGSHTWAVAPVQDRSWCVEMVDPTAIEAVASIRLE